jgi:hypothetical protein
MSDSDLATRAPESDLVEQSAIPGDTVVDQGASLGVCSPQCWNGTLGRADSKNRNTAVQIDPHVGSRCLLYSRVAC